MAWCIYSIKTKECCRFLTTDIINPSAPTKRFPTKDQTRRLKFQKVWLFVSMSKVKLLKQGCSLAWRPCLTCGKIYPRVQTGAERTGTLTHIHWSSHDCFTGGSHKTHPLKMQCNDETLSRAAQRPRVPSSCCCFYESYPFPQSFSKAQLLCVSCKGHTFNLFPTFTLWNLVTEFHMCKQIMVKYEYDIYCECNLPT